MSFESTIGNIAEVVMGQSPQKKDVNTTGAGAPLLNGPTEFSSHHPLPVQYTTDGRKFSDAGDILFCVRGSTTGRMNYADQKYAIGRGIAAIRGKNGYPTPYVRAVIEENLNRLLVSATGSTFPNVGRDLLLNFEIQTVSPEEALPINELIVAIEEKIELSTQTNQTLEQIAQAIFKSWFVGFEPVKAKMAVLEAGGTKEQAELAAMSAISAKDETALKQLQAEQPDAYAELAQTAALFPSAMEESKLGAIPVGWDYDIADNIAKVAIGKTPPRKESKCFSNSKDDIRWVSIKDMGGPGVYSIDTSEYLTEEAVNKFNVRRIPDNTVLLSFKLTVGRVTITDGEMLTNEAIAHFCVSNDPSVSTEYLYLYLKQFDFSSLGSTSSIATAVNSKTIKNMPILIPDHDIANAFYMTTKPFFKAIKNNLHKNATLIKARDTILPKLHSGDLPITNTEVA